MYHTHRMKTVRTGKQTLITKRRLTNGEPFGRRRQFFTFKNIEIGLADLTKIGDLSEIRLFCFSLLAKTNQGSKS